METIRIKRDTLSQIKKLALPRIGRKGKISLGERIYRDSRNDTEFYYWNRYTEGDDDYGDLFDIKDWHEAKYIEHELINGKLLLDYYLHDQNEFVGNLMVEIDKHGLLTVWNDTIDDKNLIYKR